jgi:hypothetical protein
MKRIVLIVSLIAAAAAVTLPATASAGVFGCPGNPETGYWPRNDRMAPNQVTSVRNISCNAAGWGAVAHGSIVFSSGNLRTRGWSCVVLKRYLIENRWLDGADVRCVRGAQAFRWTWGT